MEETGQARGEEVNQKESEAFEEEAQEDEEGPKERHQKDEESAADGGH